jgi:hypothetical protein
MMKGFVRHFSPLLPLLRFRSSPQCHVLKHFSFTFFPQGERQCSTSVQNKRYIFVSYILMFTFLDRRREVKGF